jgi:23S rRNA (pseudouridine1915-N3)-methyltransferase
LRIALLCVGKLGAAAEGVLAADWAARATAAGRAHGLGPVEIVEIESRKPGKAAEALALLDRLDGAHLIACDERGEALGSRDFAGLLAFAVGGADGLGEAALTAARQRLAFGPQTWPHALARAMLAEQLYRAASIMAGSPYHRD